jgi:hypothetical protein
MRNHRHVHASTGECHQIHASVGHIMDISSPSRAPYFNWAPYALQSGDTTIRSSIGRHHQHSSIGSHQHIYMLRLGSITIYTCFDWAASPYIRASIGQHHHIYMLRLGSTTIYTRFDWAAPPYIHASIGRHHHSILQLDMYTRTVPGHK